MEIKIQIPDNCELIKNGDSYVIKEKDPRPKSWVKFCENNPLKTTEYYITASSAIYRNEIRRDRDFISDRGMCISKKEAEAFLALMQLRQLRKAWVGDWEQPNSNNQIGFISYSINRHKAVVDYGVTWRNSVLSFPNREMAQEFLECFKDLCNTAAILL